MRRAILLPVVVFGLMVAFLVPQNAVQGQLVSTSPNCYYDPGYPGFTPMYTDCSGAWDGNNENQMTDVWNQIENFGGVNLGTWGTGWTDEGTTQSNGTDATGPFQVHTGAISGTLNFKTPFTGDFILILKAANAFSMYFYQGVTAFSQVEYNTAGVSLNAALPPKPNALSHATLLTRGTTVPEPSTIILLGTGLLGLGLVGYKRRNQA